MTENMLSEDTPTETMSAEDTSSENTVIEDTVTEDEVTEDEVTESSATESTSPEITVTEVAATESKPPKNTFGKHMVWTVDPRTQAQIGIGYSSLFEAEAEAQKLEQVGYKILKITPTTLPKPNS